MTEGHAPEPANTHIYHPHTPLLAGYRRLVSQWRQAYDIGLANAAAGAKISSWRELAIVLRNHFNPAGD